MNADAFRHLYAYHFRENRKIWDLVATLSDDQFRQQSPYSHGSVRDQLLHLIQVDDAWFGDLRSAAGQVLPEEPEDVETREALRAYSEAVEGRMQKYLERLRDDMLFTQPLPGEDAQLYLWQVLWHVVNHGTDHRAQILRLLNDQGIETSYQDYVFYAYEWPWSLRDET